jgi:hypothetical protein
MIARGLVVLLVAAGCSKGPQSSATPTPPPKDAADAAPQAPAKPDERGSNMSDDAVIKAYYKQHGWGEPEKIKPSSHVPGLYDVDGEGRVLVHQGKIAEGGGVAALTSYVRASKLALKPPLDTAELLELVGAFEAYPPITGFSPTGYYTNGPYKELNPRAVFDDRGAHLVLSYLLVAPTEATAHPNIVRVARWTLDLGTDGNVAWRSEEIKFDTKQK